MKLILASQSPRRRELLGLLNIPFSVRVADIDETMDENADPAQAVAELSLRKALAVVPAADEVVVAADTVVVCGGRILGKPRDAADAKEMLMMLSGTDHQVMTGLTVISCHGKTSLTEVTDLHFRSLTEKEIDAYIATGDSLDKAGAYGIQSGAALFCRGIEGDYYNVVGLPVCRLVTVLHELAPELGV
jgi:septum formation protein